MDNMLPGKKQTKRINGPYIFGPNSQPSLVGRAYYSIYHTDGSRTTTLRSRYMMEQHLGRKLETWEHVDHINGDSADDRIENLQVLSVEEHREKTLGHLEPWNKGKELGFKHGSMYGWMKKKCKCKECITAKRVWNDKRNEARRK
jgi:hypothetical protein